MQKAKKRAIVKDKRKWVTSLAREIDELSKRHQTKEAFQLVDKLIGKKRTATPNCSRNKQGHIVVGDEMLADWGDYGKELY